MLKKSEIEAGHLYFREGEARFVLEICDPVLDQVLVRYRVVEPIKYGVFEDSIENFCNWADNYEELRMDIREIEVGSLYEYFYHPRYLKVLKISGFDVTFEDDADGRTFIRDIVTFCRIVFRKLPPSVGRSAA